MARGSIGTLRLATCAQNWDLKRFTCMNFVLTENDISPCPLQRTWVGLSYLSWPQVNYVPQGSSLPLLSFSLLDWWKLVISKKIWWHLGTPPSHRVDISEDNSFFLSFFREDSRTAKEYALDCRPRPNVMLHKPRGCTLIHSAGVTSGPIRPLLGEVFS